MLYSMFQVSTVYVRSEVTSMVPSV